MRMKKFLVLLVAVLMSVGVAFADDTSCRVYGATDNIATINNSVVLGHHNAGGGFVYAQVSLTKPATADIAVVVNVSDGERVIASNVLTISRGWNESGNNVTINSQLIEANKKYYLSIARASCQ